MRLESRASAFLRTQRLAIRHQLVKSITGSVRARVLDRLRVRYEASSVAGRFTRKRNATLGSHAPEP